MDEAELALGAEAAFDRLLSRTAAVLIAVSGGPDSLALLALLADRTKRGHGRRELFAATVDHGLRPEAAEEAALAASACAAWRVPHKVLRWEGQKPRTGLQEAAREARYRLLAEHARDVGATHLVTAHHADDQAETVLMRLAAGSGIAGLAGMKEETERNGLKLVRPLLFARKDHLVSFCAARGIAFADDASNADPRFGRARLRRLAPLLAAEGLTTERLLTLARRAGEAEEALKLLAAADISKAVIGMAEGRFRLNWHVSAQAPRAMRIRHLDFAIGCVGGPQPALEKLEALEAALSASEGRLKRTLAGRVVTLTPDGVLSVGPAPPRRTG